MGASPGQYGITQSTWQLTIESHHSTLSGSILSYFGLFFMYCSLEYVIFTSCNLCPLRPVTLYCNVGWCVKGSTVHHCHQQCLTAEWLGLSVTVKVRVRVRARAREWDFLVCLKCDKDLCLAS